MTKPPDRKPNPNDPIKMSIRLAPHAHAKLQAAAELNGRTMNAELMARIQDDQARELRREIAELKDMVRELAALIREKH